jgi:hypothetical protein
VENRKPLSGSDGSCKGKIVLPEPDSGVLTPEALAIQIIENSQELAKKYASGDLSALGALEQKALALGAGRLSEKEIKDTLMRKLGASI